MDVVHSAFSLLIMAPSTPRSTLKFGYGGAVAVYDMPEPCEFSSLNSCQKRFLLAHKQVVLFMLHTQCVTVTSGNVDKIMVSPHKSADLSAISITVSVLPLVMTG